MAWEVIYKIEFKDSKNNDYMVELLQYFASYPPALINLKPTAEPLILEMPTGDIYEPVQGTGVTLNFYNGGNDVSNLYTIDPYKTQVTIYYNTNIFWEGYLNTEQYTEDYTRTNSVISITANDGLAILNRVPYFTDTTQPWGKGRATIGTIISTCLSQIYISEYYVISDVLNSDFTGAQAYRLFTETTHDLSNYIDEDGVSATKREVLENVLKSYGLVLRLGQTKGWLISPPKLTEAPTNAQILSSTFVYSSTIIINNKLNLPDGDYKFLNAAQRITMQSGFSDIAVNYSPYPDPRKVIPYNPTEITINPAETWATFYEYLTEAGASENRGGFFIKDRTTYYDYSDYGLVFGTNGLPTQYQAVDQDFIGTPEAAEGTKYLCMRASGYGNASRSDTSSTIVITGGYIPAFTENIVITFKLFIGSQHTPSVPIERIQIPMRVKIGSKWGVVGFYNELTMSSGTLVTNMLRIHCDNGVNTEVDVKVSITGITTGGNIEIEFGNKTILDYSTGGGTFAEYGTGSPYIYQGIVAMVGSFEILPNYLPITDADIETKGTTDTNWINKNTLETNHGGMRTGGILDRGMVLVNNIAAENWYFYADTPGFYDTLSEILLRKQLSQYSNPYRQLTADIRCPHMFYPNGVLFSKVLCPIAVLKDTGHLGSAQFYINGGTFNARTRVFSGTFDEIRAITETIA